MMQSIYYEKSQDKSLILDTTTGALLWENGTVNYPTLQIKSLQYLLDKQGESFLIPSTEDIIISQIEPFSKLVHKEINGIYYLFSSNKNLGEIKYSKRVKELENLNRFGGLIIAFAEKDKETEKKIVFIMPNIRKYEKNPAYSVRNIVREEDSLQSKKNISTESSTRNSEEYIEASIKLPKGLFQNSENQELLNSINKNNSLIQDMYYELNNKLMYLNKNIINIAENEKNTQIIDEQKQTIKELNYQLEKLIQDRKLLDNERKKAELIALNQLKVQLKLSTISIQKHIDLDEIISLKESILSILSDVFTELEIDEQSRKKIFENENINEKIEILSDNFDSKIQSLIDIREEFILHKIIEYKGV